MIKKKRVKITHAEKERIILASLEPECDIRKLATRHNLVPNTIKRWRAAYKKVRKGEETSEPAAQFIEITSPIASSRDKTLKKVELEFAEYRCQIEGSVNVNQLLQIVQILGDK